MQLEKEDYEISNLIALKNTDADSCGYEAYKFVTNSVITLN